LAQRYSAVPTALLLVLRRVDGSNDTNATACFIVLWVDGSKATDAIATIANTSINGSGATEATKAT